MCVYVYIYICVFECRYVYIIYIYIYILYYVYTYYWRERERERKGVIDLGIYITYCNLSETIIWESKCQLPNLHLQPIRHLGITGYRLAAPGLQRAVDYPTNVRLE